MNDLVKAFRNMIPARQQAKLPSGLSTHEHSIEIMDIGQSGWTVPWAMYHDAERNLWLNGSYTIHSTPGGTVQMLIRRDDEGWHVDASQCNHQWHEAGYCGSFNPISVATFRH